MIPKPMTDINSESAYEKLKFIPEHYNEIMAAYTDIMEHLRLPVMNDTGGGGSGEDCLHEVVEVVNPCPAYVQFDLNINIEYDGIYYTYKDNWGDYNTSYMMWLRSDNTLKTAIEDALRKYNREYPNNAINLYAANSNSCNLFPKTNLTYTVILLDKTTGEPVENMDKDYEFDGYEEVTYDIVSEMYDIKLALTDLNNYSHEPTILGDFYEKLVEIRSSMDMSSYLSKLPTPEEFGRLLNVSLTDHNNNKVAIKLLTEEERVEVRKYIEMNTSDNVPPDTPYMYALDLFCHPDTVDDEISVKCNINGSYSKGYIDKYDSLSFGRKSMGCGDPEDITYIHSSLPLAPIHFSNSYTYFKDTAYSYSDQSTGTVVMPQTFKLIQSKEGIDRRL
jgi:hypothetical protein